MIICGIDEVGRGALAGPIVAAGVVLPEGYVNQRLKDSKQLGRETREVLYNELTTCGAIIKTEIISVGLINKYGIGWANKELFRRLILQIKADRYILDGNLRLRVRGKTENIVSMVKADTSIPEVMAASIFAKVTRDRIMQKLGLTCGYGWDTNVGYGTQSHLEALRKVGPCKHHRLLFVSTALHKA